MAAKKIFSASLLVVCLGYFADSFDLFLYNALRVPSLTELGLAGDALTRAGIWILNLQVAGVFIGGFVWGMLGDRVGRKKALVGSVLLYSLGSIGCALVQSVSAYALMRFLTGFGLAGEIGLGATLIVETLRDRRRDWGMVAFVSFCNLGILAANVLASFLPWRVCYAVGGALGLAILLGRMALMESGLFERMATSGVRRGALGIFLKNRDMLKRWLLCVFFMMPYFYMLNLLVTLAPEFGLAVHAAAPIKATTALMIYPAFVIPGTFLCVLACRVLKKRVRALALFMAINVLITIIYLAQREPTAFGFYAVCAVFGLANFYTLLLFLSVEQFGTNMRATLGTSAISTGRATLVITNSVFLAFRAAGFDLISSAAWVGVIVFAVGFACLLGLRETYHRDMDFIEEA